MYKELIISMIVIALITIGNIITQSNTIKSVEEMSQNLNSLREEILQSYVNQEQTTQRMEEIAELWQEKQQKMAYYIEHNELEKVGTEMTKSKADMDVQEYAMAVENLDNCIFILEHIKDKSALKIVNIF